MREGVLLLGSHVDAGHNDAVVLDLQQQVRHRPRAETPLLVDGQGCGLKEILINLPEVAWHVRLGQVHSRKVQEATQVVEDVFDPPKFHLCPHPREIARRLAAPPEDRRLVSRHWRPKKVGAGQI